MIIYLFSSSCICVCLGLVFHIRNPSFLPIPNAFINCHCNFVSLSCSLCYHSIPYLYVLNVFMKSVASTLNLNLCVIPHILDQNTMQKVTIRRHSTAIYTLMKMVITVFFMSRFQFIVLFPPYDISRMFFLFKCVLASLQCLTYLYMSSYSFFLM